MHPSRNVVLALCTGVLLLTSLGMTSFSLFLPPIEAEFGWSRAMATVPYTVAMVAWGLSAPLFGKLADDYGARRVILGGVALMAAGFLGMALAQDLWQLSVAFGLLVGLAMGASTLAMVTLLISKHFDAESRGRAAGVVQIAAPLNPLLFGPLLFLVIAAFDWRMAALAASALLAGVALPLAWVGARDPGTTRLDSQPRVGWEACLPYLRNRSMLCLFAARLSCGLAFFQHAHLVVLTMSKGFDVVHGVQAVSVFGASAVGCSLLFGWLADRYGRGRILGLTYFLRGVGTIALSFAVPNELLFYLLVAVGIGPTFASVSLNSVMCYEAAGPRLAGVILGLSFIVHQVGSSVGPQVGSIVYDLTRTYDGYQFVIGLILLASAAITYNLKDASRSADLRLRGLQI